MTARNLTTDYFALLEYKDRVDPHNVLENNWIASSSVCRWIGVSCGIIHERVVALNLTNMNLRGTIPSQLGKLSFLLSLDLSSNNFYGHLPKELGQLHRLRIIQLSYNGLNGEIPSWLGNLHRVPSSIFNISSLKAIDPIRYSTTLTNAPKLENLVLWGNKFSGNITGSISNASMLKNLALEDNLFSGPIPKTLGNLRHLEVLRIINNNLITGSAIDHEWTFLSSLANCRHLRRIVVSGNPLSDVLPTYIGNLSKSLQYFFANNCELKGNSPMEIGNLNNLLLLQLGYNKLSGFIPASIGGMRNLQSLTFHSNKLGPISKSLCGLERLYEMYLGLNNLHGSIPSCLGYSTSLRYLYLNSNKLSSAIPSTLWNLKDILERDLSSNHLHNSHAIDVGNLRSLLKLNISRNILTGDILFTFGGLQTLISLDLLNNILHGHIPGSLDGLISLEFLNLCNNNLSGAIPKSSKNLLDLKYFIVSFNRLEGEIPTEGCFPNFSSRSFMKNFALCGPPRLLVPPCKNDIQENSQMNILHVLRSLLAAQACCSSVDFKALVLDNMSNGNLEKWLHSEICFLDIIQRVDIMIDVAVAIEHLHNGHPTSVVPDAWMAGDRRAAAVEHMRHWRLRARVFCAENF
ncbi:receptor kinase-like protein Xa21 [Gossypium hirsutum]|uniref:Receptor kinase-like protein Xa21 n=1 Tax=Gossypium hirsutum TaxID=3635 RepID=A0A1U8J0V3_GOSHI|nr:receptor kinase-like protein Xa21 [Gossypium hirsutum]